jgi:hypothetical protein
VAREGATNSGKILKVLIRWAPPLSTEWIFALKPSFTFDHVSNFIQNALKPNVTFVDVSTFIQNA